MNKTDLVDRAAESTNTPSKGTATLTASVVEVGVNLDDSSGTDELTGIPKNDILNGGVGIDPLTDGLGGDIFIGGSEADTLMFPKRNESLMDNFDISTNLVIGMNVINKFNTVTAANITKVKVISAIPSSEPDWNTTFVEPTMGGCANLGGFWVGF